MLFLLFWVIGDLLRAPLQNQAMQILTTTSLVLHLHSNWDYMIDPSSVCMNQACAPCLALEVQHGWPINKCPSACSLAPAM